MSRELLSRRENETAAAFVWDHYARRCGGEKSAKLELTAEATGLGFAIKVRCPNCKRSQDITDTTDW